MGDIIEFTTWQNHENIFYKINSKGINFDVMSVGPAALGLAKEPGPQCDILVIIGDGDRISIKNCNNGHASIMYPNIINREKYNRFWISWAGNFMILGNSTEKKPLLRYKSKIPDLKYVTFSVVDNGPPVHWRFEFPPMLKQPPLRAICNGKLRWVAGDTNLPNDAVIGGFDREFLYIIRAEHEASLTPGAFVPSEKCAYIPWGGHSHKKTKFEVLCGLDYLWIQTKRDIIPTEAVEAGYSEVLNEPLYIGRAFYNGSLIPGKVAASHKVCYIHYGGEEKAVENYEILITPHKCQQNGEKVITPDKMTVESMLAYLSRPRSDNECYIIIENY